MLGQAAAGAAGKQQRACEGARLRGRPTSLGPGGAFGRVAGGIFTASEVAEGAER